MYVQGVSTRKVITVLQSLLGPEVSISSTQVSRAAEQLDAGLAAWRERPLDETPYVFLDARYERVREGGRLIDCAVLVAVGVTSDGQRRVLGVSVALSEAEVHWRAFLDSLIRRGLKGVKLIISDDHAGLKAARRAALPSVPWQRCQFHLQQNAQAYVTRLDQRKSVTHRIRAIFNAPDRTEAERLLKQALEAWKTEAPKLALWAEDNLPEGFAVGRSAVTRSPPWPSPASLPCCVGNCLPRKLTICGRARLSSPRKSATWNSPAGNRKKRAIPPAQLMTTT